MMRSAKKSAVPRSIFVCFFSIIWIHARTCRRERSYVNTYTAQHAREWQSISSAGIHPFAGQPMGFRPIGIDQLPEADLLLHASMGQHGIRHAANLPLRAIAAAHAEEVQ